MDSVDYRRRILSCRLCRMKTAYSQIKPFITLDGSEIRELMHPHVHGNRQQSLAVATVAPGQSTQLHRHRTTEEIYPSPAGSGRMQLGEQEFVVAAGEAANAPSLARGPRLDSGMESRAT